jgi:hypothetical protein
MFILFIMKKIVLVDRNVPDYSFFVNSVNDSTDVVVYSSETTISELISMIHSKTKQVDRMGIVSRKTDLFIEGRSFLRSKDNLSLLIKELDVSRIDFFACNTLPDWSELYESLEKEGIIIGASSDLTGNLKYGGNWFMENTKEDIETIYFTKGIEYYSYLLDTFSEVSFTTIVEDIPDMTNIQLENSVSDLISYTGDLDYDPQEISVLSPFLFNGKEYDKLYILPDGYISVSNPSNTGVSQGPTTNPGIYVFQNDLKADPSPPKYIKYKVTDEMVVVIFNTAFNWFDSTTSLFAKVTLYLKNSKKSGTIVIEYGDMVFNTTSTNTLQNPKYYYAGICFEQGMSLPFDTGNIFTTGTITINKSKYKLYDGSVDNPKFKKLTFTPRFKVVNSYPRIIIGQFGVQLPPDKRLTFPLIPPLTDSTLEFNYISSDTSIATINNINKTITVLSSGITIITAVQLKGNMYPSTAIYTLNTSYLFDTSTNIGPFVVNLPSSKMQTFTLIPPISTLSGTFSYTSSNPLVASISEENKITILKNGSSNIEAKLTTSSNQIFTSSYLLNILFYQPILGPWFIPLPIDKTMTTFTFTPPVSDISGTFSYFGINPDIVSINNATNTITILKRGTTFIGTRLTGTNGFTSSSSASLAEGRSEGTYTLHTNYMFEQTTDVYKSVITSHSLDNSSMEIQGTVLPTLLEDGTHKVSVSVPFVYNLQEYTDLFIDYNGGILFSSTSSTNYTKNPPACIMPFHKDLNVYATEYIQYKENNDTFVVVYKTSEHNDSSTDIFFKITLYLKNHINSGTIKIEYGDVSFNQTYQAGISFDSAENTTFGTLDFFNNNSIPINTPLFNNYRVNPSKKVITITPIVRPNETGDTGPTGVTGNTGTTGVSQPVNNPLIHTGCKMLKNKSSNSNDFLVRLKIRNQSIQKKNEGIKHASYQRVLQRRHKKVYVVPSDEVKKNKCICLP